MFQTRAIVFCMLFATAATFGIANGNRQRDVIKKLIEAELAKIEQAGYPASKAETEQLAGYPASKARNEQLAGYPASKARNEQLAGYPARQAETEQFGHNSYQWPWPGHGKRSADIPSPLPGVEEPSHKPKSPGRKRRSVYVYVQPPLSGPPGKQEPAPGLPGVHERDPRSAQLFQPPAIPPGGKQEPGVGKASYGPQQGNGKGKESYGPQHGRKQRSAELLQWPPPTIPPGKQQPGEGKEKLSYGPPGERKLRSAEFLQRPHVPTPPPGKQEPREGKESYGPQHGRKLRRPLRPGERPPITGK